MNTRNFISRPEVYFYFILLIPLITYGCKDKQQDPKVDAKEVMDASEIDQRIVTEAPSEVIKNMKIVESVDVPEMIRLATGILNHRQKELNNKSWQVLDKDLWEYDIIYAGVKNTKPGYMDGYWLDFNEDLTYSYGYKKEVQGEGRFVYDAATSLLLMVDNDSAIKPREYEARISNRTIILDGNGTYKDHNINARLIRISERPE